MAGLTLKNVSKVYTGGVRAVDDLNLTIDDKEFIILVGPSGCGKSTTLRMIAGLEEISEGEVAIGDCVVNDIPPKDRDIAMVFQNYALYPHMTVEQNLSFALKMRKVPKDVISEKVEMAAKVLDIEQYMKRKPRALSGGQRQRVALGRAIVRDPKVFLFDEPLSNLDAKLRAQMRTEISKLHQRLNTTFIYVTHDQVEAMTMGTRIVVMKDGIVQQVAAPIELYDNPVNLFVATFIGTPQMNILKMNVRKAESGFVLENGVDIVEIPYPAEECGLLSNYEGRELYVGVRPEKVLIGQGGPCRFNAIVEVVEQTGSETFLYLQTESGNITARLPSHSSCNPGETICIGADLESLYFFDTETEKRVQ